MRRLEMTHGNPGKREDKEQCHDQEKEEDKDKDKDKDKSWKIVAMMPEMVSHWEERMHTTQLLGHVTRELLVPLPYRYFLWAAEHGTGPFDSTHFYQPKEHTTAVAVMDQVWKERTQADEDELRPLWAGRSFLQAAAVRLRTKMLGMIESQREVENEVRLINSFFMQQLTPRISQSTVETFLRWFDKVRCPIALVHFI